MSQLERCHGVFCPKRNECARHATTQNFVDFVPYLRNIPYSNVTGSCAYFVLATKSGDQNTVNHREPEARNHEYRRPAVQKERYQPKEQPRVFKKSTHYNLSDDL